MSTKSNKKDNSKTKDKLKNQIEELDLNNIEINIKDYKKDESIKNKIELKEKSPKEKWDKIPVDRKDDKRRVWKWIKQFLDVTVPEKMLLGLPEKVQELMKKWKKEWKVTQDELMKAVPNAEDDLELLDEIYTKFLQLKIDIVDNLDNRNLFTKNDDKKNNKSYIDLYEI